MDSEPYFHYIFTCGVVIFKERNLKAKIIDLGLILIGMVFIWMGTR